MLKSIDLQTHTRLMDRLAPIGLTLSLSGLLSGCLAPSTSDLRTAAANATSSSSTTTTTTTSVPSGVKAVKIIFKGASTGGSFDVYSGSGTTPSPGSGWRAKRLYNADGSLLASSTSSSSWPGWISLIELGISGSSNTSLSDSNCARFSQSGEDATSCNIGSVAQNCGAPSSYYRISESDCIGGTTNTLGNGGPSDGAYIRVVLNRSTTYLGSGENVMAVLEYSANAYNGAPTSPTSCFSGGVFNPASASCSDMNWQAYLKHTAYEITQPFLMFVPPSLNYAAVSGRAGGTVTTKQFVLPLATDAALSVFQLSRISGPSGSATLSASCNGDSAGTPSGVSGDSSAHCVGMVFYSLTLYRI